MKKYDIRITTWTSHEYLYFTVDALSMAGAIAAALEGEYKHNITEIKVMNPDPVFASEFQHIPTTAGVTAVPILN